MKATKMKKPEIYFYWHVEEKDYSVTIYGCDGTEMLRLPKAPINISLVQNICKIWNEYPLLISYLHDVVDTLRKEDLTIATGLLLQFGQELLDITNMNYTKPLKDKVQL